MTEVSDFRALLYGFSWYQQESFGKPVILTYSFLSAPPRQMSEAFPAAVPTFQALSESDKAVVRAALKAWSDICGVTFLETERNEGDLTFAFYDLRITSPNAPAAGQANVPTSMTYVQDGKQQIINFGKEPLSGGDVWFDTAYRQSQNYSTDIITVALHEIGHALGLKHPHDPFLPSHPEVLTAAADDGVSTVMTYKGRPKQLGPLDVAAAQFIYGAPSAKISSWGWDAAKELLVQQGTAASESIRGTGANDIIYSNGGADFIATWQGDDIIYAAAQSLQVNGGSGVDVLHTGLAFTNMSAVRPYGAGRTVEIGGARQVAFEIEYLGFTNGIFDVSRAVFAPQSAVTQAAGTYGKLVRIEAPTFAAEKAAIDIQAGSYTAQAYAKSLVAGAAQDATVPALVVYKAMLNTNPGDAHLTALAGFVHGQIFSANYQATASPRLGGYEAMGLALSGMSSVLGAKAADSDAAFVVAMYQTAFGRAATATQGNHFLGQLAYFEGLYTGAGIAPAEAEVRARGAVYGQMLGYAAQEPGNSFKADAEAALLGFMSGSTAQSEFLT